jgi:hypothetical protein
LLAVRQALHAMPYAMHHDIDTGLKTETMRVGAIGM